MNYAEIKKNDIANGPGVRTSLFVSGCRNRCENCFNKATWDFKYGKKFTKETKDEILSSLEPPFVSGLTVLGGEPFEPENQPALYDLLCTVKEKFKDKDIWCFTGFTYDELLNKNCRAYGDYTEKLLKKIDILVDGRFIESKKNISLQFRGSENQRIIDLRKTENENYVVIWDKLRR